MRLDGRAIGSFAKPNFCPGRTSNFDQQILTSTKQLNQQRLSADGILIPHLTASPDRWLQPHIISNTKIMNTRFSSLLVLLFSCTLLYAQKNAEEQAVVDEGKRLYASEMASWYGTDIFLERFPEKRNDIGGYFSYVANGVATCVFFSKSPSPRVLAAISFDSTYSVNSAIVDTSNRPLSSFETDMRLIRTSALELVNNDTFFVYYNNTNYNLIPLIDGNSKKVYILTAPKESGAVIFGNDYLIVFNEANQVVSKKRLHANIIVAEYSTENKVDGKDVVGSMHTHLPETGDLITSTDICTLMLYQNIAGWKSYMVISEKYMNVWTCASNSLAVIPRPADTKSNEEKTKKNK